MALKERGVAVTGSKVVSGRIARALAAGCGYYAETRLETPARLRNAG